MNKLLEMIHQLPAPAMLNPVISYPTLCTCLTGRLNFVAIQQKPVSKHSQIQQLNSQQESLIPPRLPDPGEGTISPFPSSVLALSNQQRVAHFSLFLCRVQLVPITDPDSGRDSKTRDSAPERLSFGSELQVSLRCLLQTHCIPILQRFASKEVVQCGS